MKKWDAIVIGAGPGGYPAAIKLAQAGLKVALIEPLELGGTCLNRGCIPSKALIHMAGEGKLKFPEMAKEKDRIVDNIRQGLTGLIKANGIEVIQGYAKFTGPKTIKVNGEKLIEADKIIIAAGSEPKIIPIFPCDGERILDSTDLLNKKTLPKTMAIIGGGVIGCEFASMYAAMGVEITIFEMLPRIISTECEDLSGALEKVFKRKGIDVRTDVAVKKIETSKKGALVMLESETLTFDQVLVCVGRSINSDKLDLSKAGLSTDKAGGIPVNEKMETAVDGIYAIGDVLGKWWLAHVATHQGLVAAKNALGIHSEMHYNAVPSVVYTTPELASVGLTLEKALEQGYKAKKGHFPFSALGKAQATHHTEGFAQVVIDTDTGQILGAQCVGYEASSMIAQMTLAVTNELTVECIEETIWAHPTISEAWLEAALIAKGTPLHYGP